MQDKQTGSDSEVNPPKLLSFILQRDGSIPNSRLPVLVYQAAVKPPASNPASAFEKLFSSNGWGGSWRNGIYTYHHYHSTAHEVLGIFSGSVTVQLGGEHGIKQRLNAGDVIIIPAGVAHKNLGASGDFGAVGAYPDRQSWDLNYGRPEELRNGEENIARVSLPARDPVFGQNGPLLSCWASAGQGAGQGGQGAG